MFQKVGISRFLILLTLMLLAIFLVYKIVEQSQHNQAIEQQVLQMRVQNELARKQLQRLQLEIEWKKTKYYQDLFKRQQQGLIKPGETVVVLQADIEALYQAYKNSLVTTETMVDDVTQKPKIKQWLQVFF